MVKISLFLYSIFKKNKKIPVAIICLLLLFSFFKIYTSRFGTDLLSYIPKDAQKTKAYLEAVSHFGGERSCYIILRGDVINNMELIKRISAELKKLPEIEDVNYKVDKNLRDFYLNMVKKRLPLYLDSKELDAFFERLTREGMDAAIRKTQLRLMMPGGGEMGRIDPLGLIDFMKPFPNIDGFIDTASGYYMLQGNKGLIIVASVSGDPRDISLDKRLLTGIDSVLKKELGKTDKLSATVTGSHAITFYEASKMKEEMKRNTFFSILLVGAVLIIFVRDIKVMLYAFLPVSMAIFISLGIYSLFFGSLTEAAGGFSAMLIGLGVDLTIILYIRNFFIRNMERSISAIASGIWAGAITTAATFSPMAVSHFRGIRELGILTSIGIIFCAIILFGIVAGIIKPGNYKILPLPSMGRFMHIPKTKTINIILIFLLLTFSLWKIRDIEFSADIKELGSVNNPARKALEDIIKGDDKKTFLIGNSSTYEGAVQKADETERILRDANIKEVISIASFLPPLDNQLSVIDKLKRTDPKNVINNFVRAAKKAGFSNKFISNYAGDLKEMLSISDTVKYGDIKNIELLKKRFLWENEKGIGFLLIANNIEAEKIPPINGITIADKNAIKKELRGFLKADALKITIIGFLLVNLILFITFKRPLDILFVQLPVVIAILFTGAVLTSAGHNIHIMSAITGVMLFGIGTDYAIYFAFHLRKENDMNAVVSQTGPAIILSALTTICGFGSLYFSSYKGLSDMGLAISIGILFCLAFIFLFLPFYSKSDRS